MKVLSIDYNLKEVPESVKYIISEYEDYCRKTISGEHGLTSKFWFQYINMIHLYHEFSRSVRNGDLFLFLYCLPKIAIYFFAFNHQNYSRWITLYHNNLTSLKDTHPNLYSEFTSGNFSIKRISKPSKTAIDLTLEQTINADTASQRTGITAMTNSISTRLRWAKMHHVLTNM